MIGVLEVCRDDATAGFGSADWTPGWRFLQPSADALVTRQRFDIAGARYGGPIRATVKVTPRSSRNRHSRTRQACRSQNAAERRCGTGGALNREAHRGAVANWTSQRSSAPRLRDGFHLQIGGTGAATPAPLPVGAESGNPAETAAWATMRK